VPWGVVVLLNFDAKTDPNVIAAKQRSYIGMFQYAQSGHATICSVITQPLATL
jgi:hypothetical protein